MQPIAKPLRRTGLEVLGERPWGTHFCVFYETNDDLLEMLIPYFKTGIERRERCFWVLADSLTEDDARRALDRAIPSSSRASINENIEFLRSEECYLRDGVFNLDRVTGEWGKRLDCALAAGYEGIRVSGYAGWLDTHVWPDFWKYEESLNSSIVDQPMMVLCSYPLTGSCGSDILDVAHTHQCSVSRRSGNWEIIETAGHKQAKAEIKRLNDELELRVVERTSQLMLASEALREAQTELAHVNRVTTMGLLAASIAHEVNQPLAAVVTNAHAGLQWLAAQPPDVDEVRTAFDGIIKAGKQAGEVVGRIRGLIKKAPPRKDDVEINEVILEVVALTNGEVVKNGVSLQTQLAAGLPLIQGDRVQLQQVILNLIVNAVEAMGDLSEGSRELLISTRKDPPSGVLVAVQDTGLGLKAEGLDRLFDPFYTTKPNGMGMGLSICRSIVEGHGGRIWASPTAGSGVTVQFSLPVGENVRRDAALVGSRVS
jgi:signal transduction histidine kinase